MEIFQANELKTSHSHELKTIYDNELNTCWKPAILKCWNPFIPILLINCCNPVIPTSWKAVGLEYICACFLSGWEQLYSVSVK